jgi:hypoxanthine-DNA glycosylase
MMRYKAGLPPVADERTEILILGSTPSKRSLAVGQYYANPSNDFWRLIGAALDENLAVLPYLERIDELKAHRVGLWDAFHTCVRPGSMDKDIREQELNDFTLLKQVAPRLRLVCLNGRAALDAQAAIHELGYKTILLPSSSSANRKNQEGRRARWRAALVCL